MFYFFIFALFAALQINYVPGNAQSIFHSDHRQIQNAPLDPIDDKDYWEADDFVPYKSDRHDTFDWKLLNKILLQEKQNVIVSPFSVKLVLALLTEAAGAESGTQRELTSILPNLNSPALVRSLYKKILNSLKEKSIHYDLNVGTKLYVDKFIHPRQRFSSIIQTHYDTDVQSLDFSNVDQTVEAINNWCSNITEGHLQNVVSRDDFTSSVMLILNAIYFNGKWKTPFNRSDTFDLQFFTEPGNAIPATFMTQTRNFYFYESSNLNAKLLRLQYKGKKFSMTILLPNSPGNLDKLIREIDGDALKRLQWLMYETEVQVTIPKFKFDYTSHLNEVLKSIGITEIFTSKAALPGLARGFETNNQLQVSHIIQKAGLIVNEEGTIASAATQVGVIDKFGGVTKEFNANHPFVFFIEDETTGTLIFAGKVINPSN